MDISLHPSGPHSVAYTEQVAHAIREGVRVLNYATGDYAEHGLPYPGTAYSVAGSLKGAAGGMGQLFLQMSLLLRRQAADGHLKARGGHFDGDPAGAAAAGIAALDQARAAAAMLHRALESFQVATNALSMIEVDANES